MLLRCPVCGSETFYVDQDMGTIMFSLNAEGQPVDVQSTGAALILDDATVMFCTACSWQGTVDDLLRQA